MKCDACGKSIRDQRWWTNKENGHHYEVGCDRVHYDSETKIWTVDYDSSKQSKIEVKDDAV